MLDLKFLGSDVVVATEPAPSSSALIAQAAARATGLRHESLAVSHLCPNCGQTDHGHPSVSLLTSEVPVCSVSFSRAAEFEVAAARVGRGIGIDIESVERVSSHPVDDVLLHPAERELLEGLDKAARPLMVARLWVAKEAILKMSGEGLRADLREIEVRIRGSRAVVRSRGAGSGARLMFFTLRPDVVGAIAVR